MANKRTYTRAQLAALAEEIDPTATATALVAEAKDLDDAREIYRVLDTLGDHTRKLQVEFIEAKRRRYGDTFVCAGCKKEQTVARKMSGHYKPSSWYESQSCAARVCYECAMASPNNCPACQQNIRHWTGGPGIHVIVRLRDFTNSNGSLYRFELDPATTALSKIKEVMLPKIPAGRKFSSIHVGFNKKAKLAENLHALGVLSGLDRYDKPYITVNYA